MKVFQALKTELMLAREAQDKEMLAFYQYVIGEVERGTRSVEDKEVVPLVRSAFKRVREAVNEGSASTDELAFCEAFEQGYLPHQMTYQECSKVALMAIEAGATNMGDVMQALKQAAFDLGYDLNGQTASTAARDAIARAALDL
ncbi:hypothetical protein [Vibrio phage VCPH]|nr:hypothetical protein [Vibrio phage VCPH]